MNSAPLSDVDPTFFHTASVLVTGGCGFIGSHLVDYLVRSQAKVTILDNMQAGKRANIAYSDTQVKIIEGDVRDAARVAATLQETKPDFVFHLAANASVPGSVQDPVYDFESNCVGTFVLLNALRTLGGCRNVVIASSGAVYGEPVRFPLSETDPLLPISPYGASKLSAETEGFMFQKVYGLSVTVARLFNTYGPRMARFVILDFLRKLQKDPNVLEILGNGGQIRDFTYVSDTVTGLLTVGSRGVPGQAYNISSGVTYSVTELAHVLLEQLGLAGKTQIRYTGSSWVGDAQHWEVSIAKLAALGYSSQVTLQEGIAQTIAWFTSAYGAIC